MALALKKKRRRERYIVRDDVVRLTGFEPTTSRVGVWHSIQLSYSRVCCGIITNLNGKVK